MTYEKIVEKLQKTLGKAKADKIDGHVAVQINVTGEGEGALYIEIENGKVDVQPYEYYDNNAVVTAPADVLIDIADGKLDMETAYNEQKLYVDGDLGAALVLKNLTVKKAAAKKTTTTKKAEAPKAAAEKKAPVKKATAKKAATTKKAEAPKAEAKVEEVKAEEPAKKAPAKKATTTKKAATTKTTAAKKTTKTTK